jgi:hypothetical protein
MVTLIKYKLKQTLRILINNLLKMNFKYLASIATFILAIVVSLINTQSTDLTRIECYPEAPYLFGASLAQKCLQRNCIYSESSVPNVPWCYYPQDSYGYTMTSSSKTSNGYLINLKRLTKYQSPFSNPIDNLRMEIIYLTKQIVNFKIVDANNQRYEVPIKLNNIQETPIDEISLDYLFTFENRASDGVFTFKIIRKSTGTTLFDTSLGGMVFCDQFLQIVTRLPTASNVYGFGENNHPSLAHDLNYKSWGIFARDQATAWGENTNQYGAQVNIFFQFNSIFLF